MMNSKNLDEKFLTFIKKNIDQVKQSLLETAVREKDLSMVQYIESHIEYNFIDDSEGRLLSLASKNGSLDIVQYLYPISYFDYNHFISAISNGHLDVVKYFVEQGVPLNTSVDFGQPLLRAKDFEMVKYLVNQGANINANVHRESVLCRFALTGNLKIISFLLENGADIHWCDDRVLSYACSSGNIDVVKYFVEKGLKVASNKNNILFSAVNEKHSSLTVIKYLISQGADVHGRDGENAVTHAGYNNIEGVLKYLVEKGASMKKLLPKTRQRMIFYLKYKKIMDECLKLIYFDPELERTKSEQLDSFHNYQNEMFFKRKT